MCPRQRTYTGTTVVEEGPNGLFSSCSDLVRPFLVSGSSGFVDAASMQPAWLCASVHMP